jgi:hypothetical protein
MDPTLEGIMDAALLQFVCKQNIERYERMLRTPLTDLERAFVQRRMAEEREALRLSQVARANARNGVGPMLKVIGTMLFSNVFDYLAPLGDLAAAFDAVV